MKLEKAHLQINPLLCDFSDFSAMAIRHFCDLLNETEEAIYFSYKKNKKNNYQRQLDAISKIRQRIASTLNQRLSEKSAVSNPFYVCDNDVVFYGDFINHFSSEFVRRDFSLRWTSSIDFLETRFENYIYEYSDFIMDLSTNNIEIRKKILSSMAVEEKLIKRQIHIADKENKEAKNSLKIYEQSSRIIQFFRRHFGDGDEKTRKKKIRESETKLNKLKKHYDKTIKDHYIHAKKLKSDIDKLVDQFVRRIDMAILDNNTANTDEIIDLTEKEFKKMQSFAAEHCPNRLGEIKNKVDFTVQFLQMLSEPGKIAHLKRITRYTHRQ